MNALVALLASCGIEAHAVADTRDAEEAAFRCTCGGAARVYDGADGRLWYECGKCSPSPGTAYSPEEFRQRLSATHGRPAPFDPPPRLQIVGLRELLADPTPRPPDVIGGVAVAGSVFDIHGPPETAKSWLAADLTLAVAAGRPWLGRFNCEKAVAVYVENERAPWTVRARLDALVDGTPLPADAVEPYFILRQQLQLDTPEAQADFRSQIEPLAPRIVIVDTGIAVAGSLNLLSPNEVRRWMSWWRDLAVDFGGAVCLLFHVPKWVDKTPRLASLYGSEDFGAALDFSLATARLDGTSAFRVCCVKNALGTDRPDLSFTVEAGPEGGMVLAVGASGVRDILLAGMSKLDWTRGADLAEEVGQAGYSDRAARDALSKLESEGKIEAQADPRNRRWREWRITRAEAPE